MKSSLGDGNEQERSESDTNHNKLKFRGWVAGEELVQPLSPNGIAKWKRRVFILTAGWQSMSQLCFYSWRYWWADRCTWPWCVWQCARGVFIDRDKCWGYCVLVSETLVQSIDEVLSYFSFTGIDSLLLTVFIIPLKAALAHITVASKRKLSGPSPPHKEFAVNPQKELSDIKANTFCALRWPETSQEQQRGGGREGWREGEG